jgi:ribosome-associated protein
MTIIDLSPEIFFQTSRSSGRGGQNVNKVETAVTGYFNVSASALLSDEQKKIVLEKLSLRINSERFLMVKSQTHRTQLANKEEVIRKMNELVAQALVKKKKRIATQISKAAKEKRLELKKRKSEIKSARKKFKPGDLTGSR